VLSNDDDSIDKLQKSLKGIKNKYMERILLSDNHRRSISSSMQIIDKMMMDIERALLNPTEGVISKTVNDIPDQSAGHLISVIKEMKQQIRSLVVKYNLKTEEVKASRIISSRKAKMWETITDTNSRKLKGYSKFPVEFAEEFDRDISGLRKLIETL
jgi:hypothetical protein